MFQVLTGTEVNITEKGRDLFSFYSELYFDESTRSLSPLSPTLMPSFPLLKLTQ